MNLKLPSEPSDPNLKAAMAEISRILVRYDIAGICQLESKTHGEWINHVTPSWSCCFFEDESHLRVRARLADYGGDKAKRDEALRLTIGMLCGFRDGANRLASNMQGVIEQVGQVVKGIEHVSKFDK